MSYQKRLGPDDPILTDPSLHKHLHWAGITQETVCSEPITDDAIRSGMLVVQANPNLPKGHYKTEQGWCGLCVTRFDHLKDNQGPYVHMCYRDDPQG